jgi:hypothetical protein
LKEHKIEMIWSNSHRCNASRLMRLDYESINAFKYFD